MIQNILWFESIALVIKARIRTQQKRKKHTTTKRFYPWACILRTCIKNRYPPPQPRSARCLCSIFIRRMVGKAREEGPSSGKTHRHQRIFCSDILSVSNYFTAAPYDPLFSRSFRFINICRRWNYSFALTPNQYHKYQYYPRA